MHTGKSTYLETWQKHGLIVCPQTLFEAGKKDTKHGYLPPNYPEYFKFMRVDIFPSLLNEQLIRLLPDLIGLPHIHFDASIMIVYYNVLYHGCVLDGADLKAGGDDGRLIYQQILRLVPVWERQASGTIVDLLAATFMVYLATFCPTALSTLYNKLYRCVQPPRTRTTT